MNQLRSLLPRLYAGNSRNLERVSLWNTFLPKQFYRRRRHLDKCLRTRRTYSLGLAAHINHPRPAFFVEVSQFVFSRSHFHSIGRNCTVSPGSSTPARRGITIKAFARARPTRSEEPFHGAVAIRYCPRSKRTKAGINAARSGSHFAGASSSASSILGLVFSALSKNRIRGRTNT